MMIGGFDGFGLVGLVFFAIWLLFVVGIILLIVLAIRWLLRQERTGAPGGPRDRGRPFGPGAPSPDDPLEILRQRYARGEIDDEEYERRRKILSGG